MPPKRPVSRKAAAPVAMEAGGNSDDWVRTKSNQKRLANLMLAWLPDSHLKGVAGEDWDKVLSSIRAAPEIYQWFSTYLCDHYQYEQKGRKHFLHFSSVMAAWGGLIAQTQTSLSSCSTLTQDQKVRPAPLRIPQPAPLRLISSPSLVGRTSSCAARTTTTRPTPSGTRARPMPHALILPSRTQR